MEDPKPKIRAFLAKYVRDVDLADDDDIFQIGLLNSMFAMQLVLFVENDFGIEVGNEDLEFDNFRSVGALAALIDRKLRASA